MPRAPILLALAAACAGRPGGGEDKPWRPDPGPPVDAACLERVAAGTHLTDLPQPTGGFTLEVRDGRVLVTRKGRDLTAAEGKALWDLFSTEYFGRGGLSSGGSSMYGVDKCSDGIGDPSCLWFQAWVCQASPATIAARVADAAARVGAADGELGINVMPIEQGPRCRGAACAPTPHYSQKRARYDPARGRRPLGGRGRCTGDGDCDGGGNSCVAWYLAGGVETLIYIQHQEPVFCGCVQGTCTWFKQ